LRTPLVRLVRRDRRLLTILLVLALASLFLAPLHADGVEEGTFDSNGVSIRYVTKGQGQPVVLVHGFSATAEANWMLPGVFEGLAQDFRVIAIDNRGHGKSGKPHDPAVYGDEMARDIVRLLDHLRIDQAHIVGYSMGGFITMRLLALAPERFASAVIGGAGWRPPGPPDATMEELAGSLERGEGIAPLLRALQPPGQPAPPAEQVAMMNQMVMSTNDPLALAAAIRGMAQLGITEEVLRANQVPALAVVGSLDPLKAGVDAMTGVMAGLEVKVIEGADHITALMNPQYAKQLLDAIHGFLVASCQCA
jgi:pimeloyl-ACP methyl ester carboxylesterase